MIGLMSALRILGGGLHRHGFTVFFLPVTQDLSLTRASTSLAFSLARAESSLAARHRFTLQRDLRFSGCKTSSDSRVDDPAAQKVRLPPKT
jgi:hypothetical protein